MRFPSVIRVFRMLATVLKRLTNFFTGAITDTTKAVRSKVAAPHPPPPPPHHHLPHE